MKRKIASLLTIALFCGVCPHAAQAQASRALKPLIEILVGAAAAGALAKGHEASTIEEQKMSIIDQLDRMKVDPTDAAIFSAYFSLNNDASAVYWSDIMSKPDIYMVVSIEGHGDYLLNSYIGEYAGQSVISKIFAKVIEPGRKIVLYVLDDDSTSDAIWNNILSTKADLSFKGESVHTPIRISVGASGTIQLLNSHQTLDAPDFIAVAEFRAPDTKEATWVADGTLMDSSNNAIGRIQFGQVWCADPVAIAAARQQRDDAIANARSEANSSGTASIFWWGLGIILILVFGRMLFAKKA